jgi:hypothetical protein
VVTDGVFRISRNPMYLRLLLLLIGWALWLGSASAWLIPPLSALMITSLQIIPEEQAGVGASVRGTWRTGKAWLGGSGDAVRALTHNTRIGVQTAPQARTWRNR